MDANFIKDMMLILNIKTLVIWAMDNFISTVAWVSTATVLPYGFVLL